MKQQAEAKRIPAPPHQTPLLVPTPNPPRPWPAFPVRLPARFDLGLVFAFALAVRLVYVWIAWRTNPSFDAVLDGFDQFTYQTQAQDILNGDVLLRHTSGLDGGLFYYSPIYAYFCAIVYKIIGHQSFWALHLLQALGGALTCALCFSLARTWLGRPAALLAGAIFALLSPWLFYEQELLHEGLMLLFYAAALWGLRTAQLGRRGGAGRLALAGAAGMLALIGRGNAAAVLAAAVPWVALAIPAGRLAARVGRWRLNLGAVAAFLAGIALVMGPLLARNHVASGRWTLGMGNGRVLFYLGNNSQSIGEFIYTPRFQEAFDKKEQEPGIFRRYFLEDLDRDPRAFATLMLRKSFMFFSARDLPDNLNYHLGRRIILPVAWTPAQWEWIVPLGLVGLAVSLRRRRQWGLLWLFGAVLAGTLIAIIPIGRYRQPVLIPLVIFAAFAVEWAAAHWRAGRRGVVLWAGVAAVLLGVVLGPWTWLGELIRADDYIATMRLALARKKPAIAQHVVDLGMRDYPKNLTLLNIAFLVAQANGDQGQIRALGEELIKNPPIAPEVAVGLAEQALRDGNLERARMIVASLAQAKLPNDDAFKRRLPELIGKINAATPGLPAAGGGS